MTDFNLLHDLEISEVFSRQSAEQKRAYAMKKRNEFNEFQYRAHIEQERRQKARFDSNHTGRAFRTEHQMRDQRHHFGNFWFASGEEPNSFPPVGTLRQAARPVIYGDDSRYTYHPVSTENVQEIVLRPRNPPPVPRFSTRSDIIKIESDKQASLPIAPRHFHTPYAEHYDANALYDIEMNPSELLMRSHTDKQGVPRGIAGVDFQEGQARALQRKLQQDEQRLQKARKVCQQAEMQRELDDMMQMQRCRKLQERKLDAEATYGCSVPIEDKQPSREAQRAARKMLEATWQQQIAQARADREKEKEQFLQREEMDAYVARDNARRNPQHVEDGKEAWLQAWKESQVAEGAKRKMAAREQEMRETVSVNPSVLAFSDRILSAEQQKRLAQASYKKQLDDQVRQATFDKRAQFAASFDRDHQFQRAPFQFYPRSE